ncbi:hypothetical protein [Gimesia maris]|uniref:hypothetical protein n=1 Tax=Gimesia maris TaxID=122 RepID=UPI0030D9066A|tara:strand:+ start:83784 stop:85466 length:1683 start_codon:yes stop_codon:yes gene_type:complete
MNWPEISIEDFPPERDDEPSSLRQDIIDELSDHFACALNRELLKNPDECLAKQRVIQNFGDPIKIARQLWLDAIKEKIMSQRIMTGISAVMAVCCIAVVGIAWILMKDSQIVNQKMLEQLAVISERPQTDPAVLQGLQQTNEAMMRELKLLVTMQTDSLPDGVGLFPVSGNQSRNGNPGGGGLGGPVEGNPMGGLGGPGRHAEPALSADTGLQILRELERLNQKQGLLENLAGIGMSQVAFQLIENQNEQKSAVGFKGTLTKSGGKTESFSIEAISNEKGRLDFGKLPWGDYYLNLVSPWNEYYHKSQVTVIPGRDYSETIDCPAAPSQKVSIHFDLIEAEKPLSEDWVLICDFRQSRSMGAVLETNNYYFSSKRMIGDCDWITSADSPGVYLIDSRNQVSVCSLKEGGEFENLRLDSMSLKSAIDLPQGEYCLPVMYLVRKQDLSRLNQMNSVKMYQTLKNKRPGSYSFNPANSMQRAGSEYFLGSASADTRTSVILIPFNDKAKSSDPKKPASLLDYICHSELVYGLQLKQVLKFSAQIDQENIWKIDLSELEQVPAL